MVCEYHVKSTHSVINIDVTNIFVLRQLMTIFVVFSLFLSNGFA